jgi:acetylornithine deacetylase/succinyl-diaminopimelate desuccinylase-like protein
MISRVSFSWLAALPICLVTAMTAQTAPDAARAYTAAHKPELVKQFSEFLSIPNVAADPGNLQRNAEFLATMLQKRGIDSQLLKLAGAPSIVFGQIHVPGAKRTIVFYAHYDGQPVTPSEWEDASPFTPTIRDVGGEQRIFARSAGDDKAAIFAQLTALDALNAAGIALKANIRFVWEGRIAASGANS